MFIVRRLAILVVQLVVLSFIVFALTDLAPGSTEELLAGFNAQAPGQLEAIRHEYHLNDPLLERYGLWLRDASHLNFGRSVQSNQPVWAAISPRLSITVFLAFYALLFALTFGLVLGVLAALRSRTAVDRGIAGAAVVGLSTPAFVTGLVLLYVFGVRLGWFPIFGAGQGFVDRIWHLTLPAIALALGAVALILKLTRASMIEALAQDYIEFARSRGVPWHRVVVRHALRNALVPVVTGASVILAYMLTGAVLVEYTFALPGVGTLLVDAVTVKDIPVIQGLVVIAAVTVILVNLAVDVIYVNIDPRIRLSGSN